MHTAWRVIRWTILGLAMLYIGIVIWAYPHNHQKHEDEAAVAVINAQKITAADLSGADLPPTPDPALVDSTVIGIDANGNGIRDDVELAIFARYPTSSATSTSVRAAELQEAMTQEMFLTKISDQATWKAVEERDSRSADCLDKTYPRTDMDAYMRVMEKRRQEVLDLVFNTAVRKAARHVSYQYATSYALADTDTCDVDPSMGQ